MIISLDQAVSFLKEGKVVAVPTETVYGLAADALNPEAIAKVFEIKNRPADNPLICHFNNMDQIKKFVKEIPATTEKLMSHFSPGPISFMLDLPEDSPLKFATCGSKQVIVRIPDHPLLLKIIEQLNSPVAAPSANTSGRVSPTSAIMVENDLGNKLDGIVDGSECEVGIESTIIDARNSNEIVILRQGVIGKKEIQSILPLINIRNVQPLESGVTPGAKYRHYAPDTPIFLVENFTSTLHEGRIALLLVREQLDNLNATEIEQFQQHENHFLILGSTKNLSDLARNFYSKLSSLDQLNISKAYFLKTDFGNSSLGKALQTRIDKIVSL
jgi:L-threonylcarbamoyladenylate synthase